MVSMGAYWSQDGDYVGVDLRAGAVDATRHLLDTGRRRIAHLLPVPPSPTNSTATALQLPIASTLSEAGLEPVYLYAQDVSLATSMAIVSDFIAGSGHIDAILCHDDGMAFGDHRALSDLNIKIGEDIALIGCDGIEETEYLSPALSAIVQPTEEMCSTAWSFLENRIQNPGREPQQIVLKPRLAIRASTVPVLRSPARRFFFQPALARGAGGPGRPSLHRRRQAGGDLLPQPAQRQFAVARLAAGVLGDGRDYGTSAPDQPFTLALVQRPGGLDVEDRFHPRGGHVGVLTAGAGRTARPQLNLTERNREPLVDLQLVGDRASTFSANSKSAAVRPPSEWVEIVTVTVSQEISRSG